MDPFLKLENRHTGEILRMGRVRDPEGREVLVIEGTLPQHAEGPPLHAHLHQREEGTVARGSLGAVVAGESIVVPTGGAAAFPAGVVHKWWNAGEELLEFNGRAIPAGDLDCYLQAIFAVLNASTSGRPSLFYLAHVLWRHRGTQAMAAPPRAIQNVALPLILFIGRMLGKYRGDNWPGSPASCSGAPRIS